MPWPDHLLSLEEWAALPEDNTHRYELAEGILLVTPRPMHLHQRASFRLCQQLDQQLPLTLEAVQDLEVVISAGPLATVRAPDVFVVPAEIGNRNPARHNVADVLLAVEVISPGSRQIDQVTKRFEYADAGIPNYWLVDIDEPATLTAYHLIDGDYEIMGEGTGQLTLSQPAPVTIDVAALVRPRA